MSGKSRKVWNVWGANSMDWKHEISTNKRSTTSNK